MIYEQVLQVLIRLLDGTKTGALSWVKDEYGDWYTARTNGREISIRFLHFETTNEIDARRHSLQLSVPGLSAFFSAGSQGYCLLWETLAAAFEEYRAETESYGQEAIKFLDEIIESSGNG